MFISITTNFSKILWENVLINYNLEIFSLVVLYIMSKITWYIPTWILLLVVAEAYVSWDILRENQVFEKVEEYIKLAR